MGSKNSSLAFDDSRAQNFDSIEENFEPQLNVLVNPRAGLKNSPASIFAAKAEEIIRIAGRFTVSF